MMDDWKAWIREIAYERIDQIERQLNAYPDAFPEFAAAAEAATKLGTLEVDLSAAETELSELKATDAVKAMEEALTELEAANAELEDYKKAEELAQKTAPKTIAK